MRKFLVFSFTLLFMLTTQFANATESDYQVIHESTDLIPLNASNTEFKFRYGENLGYYNKLTDIKLITDFDNIILLDDYLKVKKGDKLGIVSKDGNIIIPADCSKINLIKTNNANYFLAKKANKYDVYNTNGEIISDEERKNIPFISLYILSGAIKPEIVQVYIDKIEQEKIAKAAAEEAEKKAQEEIINDIANVEPEIVVDNSLQQASVEKNVQEEENEYQESTIKVSNSDYILVYQNGKFGIKDINKYQILPTEYDSISIETNKNLFVGSMFIAEKNNLISLFDAKGKKLAQQYEDKIDILGKYTIKYENSVYAIYKNNKQIGILLKDKNGEYQYKSISYILFLTPKTNKIISTMLSVAK